MASVRLNRTLVRVTSLAELVKCWRDFQSLHEDSLLSLNHDVSRPSDKSCQVSLWLNGSADTELSWGVLKESASFSLSAGG